jgi:hypothetical protein
VQASVTTAKRGPRPDRPRPHPPTLPELLGTSEEKLTAWLDEVHSAPMYARKGTCMVYNGSFAGGCVLEAMLWQTFVCLSRPSAKTVYLLVVDRRYPQRSFTIPKEDCVSGGGTRRNCEPHKLSAALYHIRTYGKEAALQLKAQLERVGPGAREAECSHLCHDPSCSGLGHVITESGPSNNARNNCVQAVECHSCGRILNVCPHQPRCLQPDKRLRDRRSAMAAAASQPSAAAGGSGTGAA